MSVTDVSSKTKRRRTFRSNRGRPQTREHHGPDLGTPELIMKRAHHVTSEPIDLCLKRRFISEEEHRAALHLRWLHTIRYGAPGITALDLTRGDGHEITHEDDPAWRARREEDYTEAVTLLQNHAYAQALIPCIIYNETPDFLKRSRYEAALKNPQILTQLEHSAIRFAEGLSRLRDHWKHSKN